MPSKPLTAAQRKKKQRIRELDLILSTPTNSYSESLALKILQLPVSKQIHLQEQVYAAWVHLGLHRGYLTLTDGKLLVQN